MRLIFIRHGDPDYVHDTLTEKSKREAELLAQRVKNWDVSRFPEGFLALAEAQTQTGIFLVFSWGYSGNSPMAERI